MQIGIVEPTGFSSTALSQLKEIGDVSLYKGEGLSQFVADKDILFIRLAYEFGSSVFAESSSLKYLCSPTTGVNHIDVQAAEHRGIKILTLRGEREFLNTIRATPEHSFGLMLSLLRNYKFAFNAGQNHCSRDELKGFEVYGKKVGIIGLGRVGSLVGKYCLAFGAQVGFYDIDQSIVVGDISRYESISELVSTSQIIFLCASHTEFSRPIIGEKELANMKGKYFINTARGELVEEVALIEAIKNNLFAGVALDVLENETGNNRMTEFLDLTTRRNLIVTPHMAGATFESMWKTEEFLVAKLVDDYLAIS